MDPILEKSNERIKANIENNKIRSSKRVNLKWELLNQIVELFCWTKTVPGLKNRTLSDSNRKQNKVTTFIMWAISD